MKIMLPIKIRTMSNFPSRFISPSIFQWKYVNITSVVIIGNFYSKVKKTAPPLPSVIGKFTPF
jgi:hypothetical protein